MTCNDCIHFDACRNLLEVFSPEYKGKNLTFTKACKHFKNKADFVEVVRCKDCKNYNPQIKSAQWNNKKRYCCRGATVKVNDDDFCSYGERKVE